jgi:hypothetical protein
MTQQVESNTSSTMMRNEVTQKVDSGERPSALVTFEPGPTPRGNQTRTGMVDEFLRVVHGELVDGGLVDGPRLDLVQVRHDDRHVVLLVVPEQKRL